jgi:hypothetical protein
VKRAIAAIGVVLLASAAPSRLLAQTMTWSTAGTDNVVTVDSGQLHYRRSKALSGDKTGWWDYTISLADIDCVRFTRDKNGEMLSVAGKANDSVLKKADPNGTTHGIEESLRHVEIDFPPDASTIADSVLHDLTGSVPDLAKRVNAGYCSY